MSAPNVVDFPIKDRLIARFQEYYQKQGELNDKWVKLMVGTLRDSKKDFNKPEMRQCVIDLIEHLNAELRGDA